MSYNSASSYQGDYQSSPANDASPRPAPLLAIDEADG